MWPGARRAVLAAVLMGMPAAAVPAAEDPAGAADRLDAVEEALDRSQREADRLDRRASDLRREAETLRRRMIEAARAIQNHEADMVRLDAEIAGLDQTVQARTTALTDERGRYAKLLLALRRIASHPPEALVVHPLDPDDMVRGAILLRAAVPAVEQRAASLRAELASLADLRRNLDRRRLERDEATAALDRERHRLAGLLENKGAETAATETARRQAAMRTEVLSREASDLRDLLARLETESKAREEAARQAREARVAATTTGPADAVPPPPEALVRRSDNPPISEARGAMPFPAVGQVIGRYGQGLGSGLTRKGIVIQTVPRAQVVAPYDGQVVYAGPFRGYGLLLIIEHGEGYHTLLTGMDRIDTAIGHWVLAGEPVAVMGLASAEPPNLYVELRRAGQPINPLPWLAARKGKVSG